MLSPSPRPRGLQALPNPPARRYRDDSPPPIRRDYDSRPRYPPESSRGPPRDRDREWDPRDRDEGRAWARNRVGRPEPPYRGYEDGDRLSPRRPIARTRSPSPEEGQITSESVRRRSRSRSRSPRRRSPSPLPLRRRSPSPRRRSPSLRRRSPSPRRRSPSPRRGFYSRGRTRSRSRSPYRENLRRSPERGTRYYNNTRRSRSRSPYSPPPRSYPLRRDGSPSSHSTHSYSQSRSSRNVSPRKRISPEKKYDTPFPASTGDRRIGFPSSAHISQSTDVSSKLGTPARQPPTAVIGRPFLPPSAPRSERLGLSGPSGSISVPTGPRALTAIRPYTVRKPLTPLASSPKTETIPLRESTVVPTEPPTDAISGPGRTPHSVQPVTEVSGTPAPRTAITTSPSNRLSWSERKKAITPDINSPTSLSPSINTSINPYIPQPTASGTTSINPYISQPAMALNTQSTYTSSPVHQVQTASPKREEAMELDPSPISGIGSNTNSRPVSSHGPPMSEAETEEMRMKKEGEKILSELPPSIIAPGPSQWEIDLANHHTSLQGLQKSLFHAQALQRYAASVLADAEGERIAAMDRRRIAESQIGLGIALGVSGLLGV